MGKSPWVVIAGMPHELGRGVVQTLASVGELRVVAWSPLEVANSYTRYYLQGLYDRMCAGFRKKEDRNRERLLREVRLVVVYVPRGDGDDDRVFKHFGTEALVTALTECSAGELSWSGERQKKVVVNRTALGIRREVKAASALLNEIADEVDRQTARTCLLLPPRNFGKGVREVFDLVKRAGLGRMTRKQFKAGLTKVAGSLPSEAVGGRRFYVGRGGLVFESCGPRHALAPGWDDSEHQKDCVVRGRLRFGASFNPRFHYDCQGGRVRVELHNCHEDGKRRSVGRGGHANIAPNDHVRM